MSEAPYPPLTPEEEGTITQLQQQQLLAFWQAQEDKRVALWASLAPLDAATDIQSYLAAIPGVVATLPIEERDLRDRLLRIEQVLANDDGPIRMRIESARNPAPLPMELSQNGEAE